MPSTMSRLLSLPPELRQQLWNLLLAPDSAAKPGTIDKSTITTVSRTCSSSGAFLYKTYQAHAHELDDITCQCHSRSFYIHSDSNTLSPVILRVNKQIYREALPSLYERRTFNVDPNRRFVSLWDRYSEAWFLFDCFLKGLSEEARRRIRSIKMPMLLSRFEVQGARQTFYSIAKRLPNLQTVEIEVSPSAVRQRWIQQDDDAQQGLHGLFNFSDKNETYFLGPLLAFANANMLVTAVDKHDMGPTIFERIKPHIEMRVWRQLLPDRVKREQRRIARIKRALGALEYDEVAAHCNTEVLVR